LSTKKVTGGSRLKNYEPVKTGTIEERRLDKSGLGAMFKELAELGRTMEG